MQIQHRLSDQAKPPDLGCESAVRQLPSTRTVAILCHLPRDDLKPGHNVRTYVRTSSMKHNAATNQIVVFVKVDETFTTMTFKVIRGQGQGQEMTSVTFRDYFIICPIAIA